jgi:serine/threonine-protein kinase
MSDELERLRSALAGRYRLQRELGRGGMATVYLADDLKHDRQVALKVLHPELAATLGAERFLREIRISARLTHPNILPVHDSGVAVGFLYYVMPYVEGESLRDRLSREKQLPLGEALQIAREIADALSYAHAHGVVHRDIKPDNILLESGHPVVADFGIARAMTAAGAEQLTATGVAVGTPAYMSPEQAAGSKDLDGRSDLYSVGCVLYEMLAGVPPFTGPTAESVVRQHLLAEPPNITARRSGVPTAVAAALSRALSKTPADRFTEISMFADALRRKADVTAPPAASILFLTPKAKGLSLLGIAGLVSVAALLLMLRAGADAPVTANPTFDRTAIAVLPFQNLSGAGTDEYFAGGLHNELLTQLSRVASLKVISRTSVMAYEGTTIPLREIATKLGVGSVVEGSVQVVGGRLRVNVQLIDAASDAHRWVERYDRPLEDAFAIQSDIAQQIVAAVGAALTEPEQQQVAAAPTANAEAYRFFLKGNAYFARGMGDPTVILAAQMYDSAVALDPAFALAQAAAAKAHGRAYIQGHDFSESRAARARSTAERARALRPDLAEANEALGWYQYWVAGDWNAAVSQFTAALSQRPGSSDIQLGLGLSRRRLGQWDDALRLLERARKLDPLSSDKAAEVGISLMLTRRYSAAVEALRDAISLAPDQHRPYGYLAAALVARDRNLDTAILVLRSGATAVGERQFVTRQLDATAHNQMRWILPELFPGAFIRRSPSDFSSCLGTYYGTLAEWHWRHGRRTEQLAYADSALGIAPRYPMALALSGKRVEALRTAKAVLDTRPAERDRRAGPEVLHDLARMYVMLGETRLALDLLEQWAVLPSEQLVQMLRFDPVWNAIRSDRRFQQIAGGR